MSTNVGMGSCCLSGKLHEGKPTGREDLNTFNVPTYIAEPANKSTAKTVVFLVDIFGWKLTNTRLLADSYAKAGFYVYVPDLHNGDSLPESFLDDVEPPLKVREQMGLMDKTAKGAKVAATLPLWLAKHGETQTKSMIYEFLRHLKTDTSPRKIGVVGFCWGGRYAILEAAGNVDAAVAFHPSLVSVPKDFEPVSKPLYIGVGDKDSLLDMKTVDKIKALLANKTGVPSETEVYEDQVHGFSLRGDFSSDKDKAAMDKAELKGQGWLDRYLS